MQPRKGERTTSVHGRDPPTTGSLATPIHQTSTFAFADAAAVDDAYEGRVQADVYSRYSNPSTTSAASRVAALEDAEAGLVLASGMAAISATFFTFVPAGGRIVANADQYGNTLRFLRELTARHRVTVDLFPSGDTDAMRRLLETPTDLVYLETPTNPTLRLVDLAVAAGCAKAAGAVSAVDSTFASPVNSKPLALGMDLVIHSATKYLSGHSDITAGAIVGSRALLSRIEPMHRMLGAVLDPHAAFLLERGMKTLPLRVKASNENAQLVAEHLARHPGVERVHYPGLPTHPQHALAKRQMPGGFGGLLSFDLASFDDAKRFLDRIRLVRNAASLGGVESLCSLPFQQSHRNQPADVLAQSGIVPGTVRLAVGIEDGVDIVADVEQALAGIAKR